MVLRSVIRCAAGDRALLIWRRDGAGELAAVPWRCRSWRCPRCALEVAALDYARIRDALLAQQRLLYVVLTAPGWVRREMTAPDAYTYLGACWREGLRKPLARRLGRFAYVQTWERHRTGYPHVNLVLAGSEAVGAALERGSVGRFHLRQRRHYRALRFLGELRELAVRAGFGPRLWCEPLRDGQEAHAALASYLAKIAREFVRAQHKPGDQRPLEAPPGFRRLRSSVRFLPPRPVSSYTGRVIVARPENLAAATQQELEHVRRVALELQRAVEQPGAYRAELELALERKPRTSLELALSLSPDEQ